MKEILNKLIETTERELERDKELMADKDIAYDKGYINALTYVRNILLREL